MVHLGVRLATVFAKMSFSRANLHSWRPPMSCICSAGGGYDENRISLGPITAANTATAGGNLEPPECSDPTLAGYLAQGKTYSPRVPAAAIVAAASRILQCCQALVPHRRWWVGSSC